MKVCVDVTWMVGNYRGMGRFARQLIAPVITSVVGLAPRGISAEDLPCISRGWSFFPWWEQVELPRLCRDLKPDYLLCAYNTGPIRPVGSTRLIAVVHDLIFLQPWSVLSPSVSPYQTLGRIYRRAVVPAFVRRADVILTVSQYTKRELIEKFGIDQQTVHVIPNAIAENWFVEPLPLESRKEYLFTVAGEQPSKNTKRLLEAFALALPRLDGQVRLKIAGIKRVFHEPFKKYADRLGIGERVDLLGYISEQELQVYYREARAFVFASLFEGFGIPLLEAMASGTPIACSSTSSMPEVVGQCAAMFDPKLIEDMADKIRYVWDCSPAVNEFTLAAIERARAFSQSTVSDAVRNFWIGLA